MHIPDTVRIIGIDPGITAMGVSIMDYYTNTGNYSLVHHETVKDTQVLKHKNNLVSTFGRQLCILDAHYDLMMNLFNTYKPDWLCVEGAYMHRFPKAYESLVLVIHTIQRVWRDYSGKPAFKLQPSNIKKDTTSMGSANKDDMESTIRSLIDNANITVLSGDVKDVPKIDLASKHEFDSMGACISFVKSILLNMISSGYMPEFKK